MKEVGVEAVVKNLNGFLSDIRKMTKSADNFAEGLFDMGVKMSQAGMGSDSLFDGIINVSSALSAVAPQVGVVLAAFNLFSDGIKKNREEFRQLVKTILNVAVSAFRMFKDVVTRVIQIALKPFRSAWDAVTGAIRRVAEIASGILIAGTIRKLGQTISEAGSAAFEAAVNFQSMLVRLEGLAARQALNSGEAKDFGEALDIAGLKSKELLDWVTKLSLTAPISTEAIANTLTMATSYGLAEDNAKDMTKAVLTFASGMGLTDVAQRRIIENFGQMIQQGKITSMELRDMGRGAFVPVNDLLNKTAELLGMTGKEFDGTAGSINDFAKKKGLDPTMAIMDAFIDLTNTEFQGAIERMGRTVGGLQVRFKNLINTVVGLEILKPALDIFGEKVAVIFDALVGDEGFWEIVEGIGGTVTGMMEDLIGELPSVETIVETIKTAMTTVATALEQIRDGDIRGALETLGVPEEFMGFLDKIQGIIESETMQTFVENITSGFANIKTFWEENKGPIIEAVKIAIGEIADALGIEMPESPGEAFLKWTQDLDATKIIDTVTAVKDAVIEFIDKVKELIPKLLELIPVIIDLAKAYFILKYPLKALALGLITGTIKGWGTGGSGPTSSVGEQYMASRMGGSQATTNYTYNMSMSPQYQTYQSPASITDDVSILLQSAGP